MSKVQSASSVPPYIDDFIKTNNSKLNEIYDDGISKDAIGCLYMQCSQKENKMDVSFLNVQGILILISEESWESIVSNSNQKRIYIIRDNDINSIFIVYL